MRIMLNLFILFIITMSAFTVVHLKHKNRTMNINIEDIEQELSFELNEHKRLLDTKAKLINQKVENTDFKESLGMEIPSKKKIIYLDLVE